jgi:hypothetical protein
MRMDVADVFVQEYKKVAGNNAPTPALIKAACLYVFDLRLTGFSLEAVLEELRNLMASAGGQTPATSRLDAEIIQHCIEEYNRPARERPPETV